MFGAQVIEHLPHIVDRTRAAAVQARLDALDSPTVPPLPMTDEDDPDMEVQLDGEGHFKMISVKVRRMNGVV